MRIPTVFFIVLASLSGAVSCSNDTNKTAEKKDTLNKVVSPFTGVRMDGLYKDTLPCADCSGIITALDLNADSTFTMEQEYTGIKEKDGEHIYYQLGKWTAVDSILTLNEITEGPRQFKICGTGALQTLDNEGVIITGTKLNYILHRKDEKFVPKRNIPIRGMLAYTTDSRLKICNWNKDYPVIFSADANAAIKSAAAKLSSKPGERILIEAEGKFISRPVSGNAGDTVSISIEKFGKFLPGVKCKF